MVTTDTPEPTDPTDAPTEATEPKGFCAGVKAIWNSAYDKGAYVISGTQGIIRKHPLKSMAVTAMLLLGSQYVAQYGSAIIMKKMYQRRDVNGDGALDMVVDMRWPLKDSVYIQKLDENRQPTGTYESIWSRSQNEIDAVLTQGQTTIDEMVAREEAQKK